MPAPETHDSALSANVHQAMEIANQYGVEALFRALAICAINNAQDYLSDMSMDPEYKEPINLAALREAAGNQMCEVFPQMIADVVGEDGDYPMEGKQWVVTLDTVFKAAIAEAMRNSAQLRRIEQTVMVPQKKTVELA